MRDMEQRYFAETGAPSIDLMETAAAALCEAIVQRTMQYVDPSNNPEDSDYTPEGKKNGKGLSPTNKVMGRQFRIVSFKWLDNWDI